MTSSVSTFEHLYLDLWSLLLSPPNSSSATTSSWAERFPYLRVKKTYFFIVNYNCDHFHEVKAQSLCFNAGIIFMTVCLCKCFCCLIIIVSGKVRHSPPWLRPPQCIFCSRNDCWSKHFLMLLRHSPLQKQICFYCKSVTQSAAHWYRVKTEAASIPYTLTFNPSVRLDHKLPMIQPWMPHWWLLQRSLYNP